ncbi:alpha/beta fold hydrolase [Pseudomonas sp. N040]|uniref:alpha/beta fold hydrolase n=1 Tax=Pseudomonas sp. N040 TaxID=2785325 RepID=UPI0018A3066B|nr:alpha/beta fold hydrolase [Pseudomonas sp. N040]MBF7731749.1 alpha/beta fold hydrolase [Pseudomonas sp. N040]MBW7015393.1 alpha/beta fold hydrolase [Pseudomonas sp. N040]
MINLLRQALDQSLEINERLAASASNGFDWLFRRDQLIKSGLSDFDLVHDGGLMTVRYYSLTGQRSIELADGSQLPIKSRKHAVPLVLVPPLGVTSETFDLLPNRSLVRYMAARGFKVYLINWGEPGREHAALGMTDYADRMMGEALQAVRAHSGVADVSLMGWCMGGLLSLLYSGLKYDKRIRNIITVASPIDMRGGGMVAGVAQALNTPAKLIRKYTDFKLLAINPAKLHTSGWVTSLAFKLTDPVSSLTTYWDLITRLWDREFVESHSTTSDYLNNMLSYPVGMLQDMLIKVVVDNKLAKGEIEVGSKISRFRNIRAAMLVFAGEQDALVSASTARGILDLVSSQDKHFEVAPGGHMGVILGSNAQRVVWAKSADWLVSRSLPAAKPAKPAKAPNAEKVASKAATRAKTSNP